MWHKYAVNQESEFALTHVFGDASENAALHNPVLKLSNIIDKHEVTIFPIVGTAIEFSVFELPLLVPQ